ncbi:MAG: serine/threonine-protein kinase [Polyangiaceae bacterium]
MTRLPSPIETGPSDTAAPSIDEILLAAGEMEDLEEREAYLDGLANVPPDVIKNVRRVLRNADRMPETFLCSTALSPITQPSGLPAGVRVEAWDLSGTSIGRLRLIERLGEGSMGEVYSAHDEQLDRKVAVKLVKPGVGSGADTSERLLREAKTLARLSHPNVVQVHEAGTFRERVYLAMELVRGKGLDKWMKEQAGKASWREVLALFLPAGEGLFAAHRAGLVHRDFKPANVLVGEDGRVRVVDFGLARSEATPEQVQAGILAAERSRVEPSETEGRLASLTETGGILGTPAYMSPEQWLGKKVDGRSDQFSFCVALYEALYGKRPYDAPTRSKLARLAIEGGYAPPPRTTAVPKWLWPIVERGLSPDVNKRYPDMRALLTALSQDPERRRRKLLARGGVAAAVVASMAVAAGAMVSRTTEDPCAQAGASVDRLWSAAAQGEMERAFEATKLPYAKETWGRLSGPLGAYARELGSERRAACEATHVDKVQSEEVLSLRTICLDRRERGLGVLLGEFARADASLVEHGAEAVASLPRADGCRDGEALLLGVRPPEDPQVAAKVAAIQTELARAEVLSQAVRYKEALAIAEPQIEAARALGYRPAQADAAHVVGRILADLVTGDEVGRAEKLLREAVDLAVRSRHDVRAAEAWVSLVHLAARHHSNREMGYLWAESALSAIERAGNDSSLLVHAMNEIGSLYAKGGRTKEAEKTLRGSLELAEKHGEAAVLKADAWQFLANVRKDLGDDAGARAAFESAMRIGREAWGEGHPRMAFVKHDYGMFLQEAGDFMEARRVLNEGVETWSKLYDPKHFRVGQAHLELAELERRAGRLEEAEAQARTALGIYEHALSKEDVRRARPFTSLGIIHYWQERYADALSRYEEALAIQTASVGEDNIMTVMSHGNIAEVLLELPRLKEAGQQIALYEQGLDRLHTEHPFYRAFAHKLRGQWLLGRGDTEEAIASLESGRTLLQDRPGDALDRAEIEWILARALRSSGEGGEARARSVAESARGVFASTGKAGEPRVHAIDAWLGRPGAAPGPTPSR